MPHSETAFQLDSSSTWRTYVSQMFGREDVWARRRFGERRLGDRFLEDHLGDTGWTFK